MTNPRTTVLAAVTFFTVVLLVTLVASSDALWTSWPGTAVRVGGSLAAAAGLYTLAAWWDRRTAPH